MKNHFAKEENNWKNKKNVVPHNNYITKNDED